MAMAWASARSNGSERAVPLQWRPRLFENRKKARWVVRNREAIKIKEDAIKREIEKTALNVKSARSIRVDLSQ